MPYVIAAIIAVTSAIVIMLTRFEVDDSSIKEELTRMGVMVSMVDGFVNTYIESGESISDVNFEVLDTNGVLLSNATVTGTGNGAILTLPNSTVTWQLIPNINDSSSYKLLVNMTGNAVLLARGAFSESFVGREYCENDLFGTFETNTNSFDDKGTSSTDDDDFVNSGSGSRDDAIFACIVFK